jgi:hypothetical protein
MLIVFQVNEVWCYTSVPLPCPVSLGAMQCSVVSTVHTAYEHINIVCTEHLALATDKLCYYTVRVTTAANTIITTAIATNTTVTG